MGQTIPQNFGGRRTKEMVAELSPVSGDSLRPAIESASSSGKDGARRPARRRWRIPLLLTIFAFLFMYVAERHADELRQRLAAYEIAGSR